MKMKMNMQSCEAGKSPTVVSAKPITSSLILHIQGLQNLKPILKNIYILICSHLSSDANQGNCTKIRFKLEDTTTLSSILIKELYRKLSLISHEASLDQEVRLTFIENDVGDSLEVLLLWRCCCIVVWLHPHDYTIIHNFRDVVSLLQRSYHKLISSQSVKPTDSSVCLIKQMLEVYVDEVFSGKPFQESLAISQSISSTWQNQPMSSIQILSILEVICAHFLLSVSGDNALQTFLESLIWTKKRVKSRPELCLTVGLMLIKHPVLMSSPSIMYSHLISLISEVLGNRFQKTGLHISRSQFKLSAFYDSVHLYSKHFSKLLTSSSHQLDTPGKTVHRDFKSLFQLKIIDKVNMVIVDMDNAWRAQIRETASNKIIDAISYLKMNLHIIGKAHRYRVFTFMSFVISKLVYAEVDELLLERIRDMTLQDMCLLASIFKLMSCSLLQATSDSKKGLRSWELLSENKYMLFGNNSCFAQCNLLPKKVQQHIFDDLKPVIPTNDESKLMLVHFAGLLSLCITSGLDVLVKSCIIFMLVLMNFLTRKKGERLVRCESHKQALPQATSTIILNDTSIDAFCKTQTNVSCTRAAANFRRARHILLRRQRSPECSDISDEETCNGEVFLKCFTKNSKEIAELADFIKCDKKIDYPSWLINRENFRHKKIQKMTKQRKVKMMKAWRSISYQPLFKRRRS